MTDHQRTPHPLLVARVLPAGSAIILRDYQLSRRAGLAAQLRAVTAQRGVKLLIGADIALAEKIGADGVHFPSWVKTIPAIGSDLISTVACHNAKDLKRAATQGAHMALLSPVFPTRSHAGEIALGIDAFRQLAATAGLPVLALGGVIAQNAHHLAGPNIAGIAAISAFTG